MEMDGQSAETAIVTVLLQIKKGGMRFINVSVLLSVGNEWTGAICQKVGNFPSSAWFKLSSIEVAFYN